MYGFGKFSIVANCLRKPQHRCNLLFTEIYMNKMKCLAAFILVVFFIPAIANENIGESNLEKIPYVTLLSSAESISSNVYQGSSYPIRFFGVPGNIKYEVDRTQMIVMMTDKMGSDRLLMLVPKDKVPLFQSGIKDNTEMKYAFRPVGVFNKYPLLQLVDLLSN